MPIKRNALLRALLDAKRLRPQRFGEFVGLLTARPQNFNHEVRHSVTIFNQKYSSRAIYRLAKYYHLNAGGEILPRAYPGPVEYDRLTMTRVLFENGLRIDSHHEEPDNPITEDNINQFEDMHFNFGLLFYDEIFDPVNIEDGRIRVSRSVVQRQGRTMFRNMLLKAYNSTCAITGCRALAVLEAAHILPYRGSDTDHVQNGLLLRADIHTLFDLGLLDIDEKNMTVIVDGLLENTEYMDFHGKELAVPESEDQRPSPDAIVERRRLLDLE